MGLPLPLIAVALVLSASIGLMLAASLSASTEGRDSTSNNSLGSDDGPGKNEAGLTVISEKTLGIEVRGLVEWGQVPSPATFDLEACREEQDITDQVLAMEEIEWQETGAPGWLLIHGPVSTETLEANGGIIHVTVVTSTCGSDPEATGPDNLLWSGSTMVGVG